MLLENKRFEILRLSKTGKRASKTASRRCGTIFDGSVDYSKEPVGEGSEASGQAEVTMPKTLEDATKIVMNFELFSEACCYGCVKTYCRTALTLVNYGESVGGEAQITDVMNLYYKFTKSFENKMSDNVCQVSDCPNLIKFIKDDGVDGSDEDEN
eukprot:GHVP01004129.1.p1 GENE.GHVP01004129.1~~GHVP01004129.1.p1  ORF type:complete len:155 (+),score=24.55 GHVP01004129.1:284-748(+)